MVSINDAITKVGQYLKKEDLRVGFFDLETQNLFVDIDPQLKQMKGQQKRRREREVTPELRMSVGGFLTIDLETLKPMYSIFEEDQVDLLITEMLAFDWIIGFSLIDFDWLVLSRYAGEDQIRLLRSKTFDMFQFFRMVEKQFVGLEDLSNLNFGLSKTHDSKKIPQMWRDGMHKEVIEYLKNDLRLLTVVFSLGIDAPEIQYTARKLDGSVEIRKIDRSKFHLWRLKFKHKQGLPVYFEWRL